MPKFLFSFFLVTLPGHFLRNHAVSWLDNVYSNLGILAHLYEHVSWLAFRDRHYSDEQILNVLLICVWAGTHMPCD